MYNVKVHRKAFENNYANPGKVVTEGKGIRVQNKD